MYNMLIVDDEPTVVKGLAYDIDWDDLQIGEIYKAYNAQQALEYLDKNRIDIVITDIKMAGIDGLEMAEQIRTRWPYAKILILSGYDEFEYAQKAISLGILEYITKPASYEEIKNAVRGAINKIEDEWRKLEIIKNAEEQLAEVAMVLQERYLNSWIVQGHVNEKEPSHKWAACGLNLKLYAPSFLILIKIDELGNERRIEEEVYKIAIRNLLKDILLKEINWLSFEDPSGNQVVIVQDEDLNNLTRICRYIEGMAELFQATVQRTLGCIISIYWDDIVFDAKELHLSYNNVIRKMRYSIPLGVGLIIGPDTLLSPADNKRFNAISSYPPFSVLIELSQLEEAISRIKEIFGEIKSMDRISTDNLLEIYYMISNAVLQDSLNRGIGLNEWCHENDQDYFYSFEKIKSIDKLEKWCLNITEEYLRYVLNLGEKQNYYLIEKAKKIILQNLNKEISLNEIASQLYLHPNYLSRLFKKEVGLSITDYQIQLRIEKAKEILREPGVKVYEAAERVGYESVAYFNRIFKREVGMTPKEYQKNFFTS